VAVQHVGRLGICCSNVCIAWGLIPPSLYPGHYGLQSMFLSLGNFFGPSWQDVKCFCSGEKKHRDRARTARSVFPLDSGICVLLFFVVLTPQLDPPFPRIPKHERKKIGDRSIPILCYQENYGMNIHNDS
jgi:hypothetical protein